MKVVRWLGAFGNAGSLHEALGWELSSAARELAAEPLSGGESKISHAKVGLLAKSIAVIKIFDGDCWSVNRDGRLVKTRNPRSTKCQHKEAWIRPDYAAIVIKGQVSAQSLRTVKWFGDLYQLPILRLKKGGELVKI